MTEQDRAGAGSPGDSQLDLNASAAESVHLIRALKVDPQRQTIWGLLNVRYQRLLWVYAAHQLGPKLRKHYDVDDLVNEAWMKVIQKFDSFEYREKGAMRKWLCTQIRRTAADWGRRARGEEVDSEYMGALAHQGRGPSSVVGSEDSVQRMTEALESERMPSRYRDALIALIMEERDVADYAEEIGLSADTTRKLKTRSLQRWREVLGEDPGRYI